MPLKFEYTALHEVANKIEPRVARSIQREFEKLQDGLSINVIAQMLSMGKARNVMMLIPKADVEEALKPAARIVEESVFRGGRLGADQVNEEID